MAPTKAVWLLSAALLAGIGAAAAAGFDPAQVPWRAVRLETSLLGLTAASSVDLELDGPTASRPALMNAPGAMVGGAELARLDYRSSVLGQHFDTELWLDARTGGALQYAAVNTGRSPRYRIFRFADAGAYVWTRRPLSSEEGTPQEQWSDRSQEFRPFPTDVRGQIVTDPISLLYIVAAADLNAQGDEVRILALTGREISRVRLRVVEPASTFADFVITRGTASQRCRGDFPTSTVRLTVEPIAGGNPDFDFLGLRSDISVFLDRASRLPLAISGRAKLVGYVTVRLQEAALLTGAGCPT